MASDAEPTVNRRVTLAARPDGHPVPSDYSIETEEVDALPPGQVRIGVDVLSIDAFIRTTFDEGSFHGTVPLGGTIGALGVGTVVESADESLAVGDVVAGGLGAQTVATLPAGAVQRIDTSEFPASTHLGALGLTTGLTAYVGMVHVGAVGPGDTVVVSGAAGAVGTYAGQFARLAGAERVIGIAGGPEKGAFLVDELGYDASIDYRGDDVGARLDELAPDGVDVFFDSVGGEILDEVLVRIRERARVVICGAISQYGNMDAVTGPSNYLKLAERHARMEGFTVLHFADRFDEARQAIGAWIVDGSLVQHDHVEHGIEAFPHALDVLLTGGHRGKLMVAVS